MQRYNIVSALSRPGHGSDGGGGLIKGEEARMSRNCFDFTDCDKFNFDKIKTAS